jgi:hypothetical protein
MTPSATVTKSDEALEKVHKELNEYVEQMKNLSEQDVSDAMAWVSSVSARVLELVYQSYDHDSRTMQRLRLERLQVLQAELKFQFQILSRRQALRNFEWEVAK